MEFCLITCSSTLREDLENLLKKNDITGYTILPMALGAGAGGGTRLDNGIWPGQNIVMMVCLSVEQYKILHDWITEYRKNTVREGLKLFNLALKEVV